MSKIALTFAALLLALTLYGSMALRHAFVAAHSQTTTANSIIDEASR